MDDMEQKLLSIAESKSLAYQLQDIKCLKCNETKGDNMSEVLLSLIFGVVFGFVNSYLNNFLVLYVLWNLYNDCHFCCQY